jgi:hypothetical protein
MANSDASASTRNGSSSVGMVKMGAVVIRVLIRLNASCCSVSQTQGSFPVRRVRGRAIPE